MRPSASYNPPQGHRSLSTSDSMLSYRSSQLDTAVRFHDVARLPFRLLALVDLYTANSAVSVKGLCVKALADQISQNARDSKLYTPYEYEMTISGIARSSFMYFCHAFRTSSFSWAADVVFSDSDPYSHEYAIIYRAPMLSDSTCAVTRAIGCDRLMQVSIRGLVGSSHHACHEFWAQRLFFSRGISFGGKLFKFFGCKEVDRKTRSPNSSSESDALPVVFNCWYVAVDWTLDSGAEEEARCNSFSDGIKTKFGYLSAVSGGCHKRGTTGRPLLTIPWLRSWLGDFAGMSNLKMNARLSLGFSASFPSPFQLNESRVFIVKDIFSAVGNCMTDGCGLIAVRI
jgi:hypothetical protein